MTWREGDSYVTDDETGLKILRSEAVKRWDGALVHKSNWEPRHPQDFVRAKRDVELAKPTRPLPAAVFTGMLTTTLIAAAALGDATLSVTSSVRMLPGDRLGVTLSNGDVHWCSIVDVPDTESIVITPPMPGPSPVDAVVTNYTAMSEPVL